MIVQSLWQKHWPPASLPLESFYCRHCDIPTVWFCCIKVKNLYTSLHACQNKIPHLDFSAWSANFCKKIPRGLQCKAYEEQGAEQRRWLPAADEKKTFYNEGLNTQHIGIPNVLKFRFPMVWFWNGPFEPLEIITKWPPFFSSFQWFWTKWVPFCSKQNTIG